MMKLGRRLRLLGLCLSMPAAIAQTAAAAGASDWFSGNYTKARLIADGSDSAAIVAGLEISLDDGWKTYWRTPGDAGGMAPSIDLKSSTNLKSAEVLFPAAHRFKDAAGESIGYKSAVVLPIRITAVDPGRPVELVADVLYGVCRDICVPVEAQLKLTIEPGVAPDSDVAAGLARAVQQVPGVAAGDGAPSIDSAKAVLTGDSASITVLVKYPQGIAGADLFAEVADQSYLPQPQRLGEGGDVVRFKIDLAKMKDAAGLKGKELVLTAVSAAGASETRWTIP